MLFDDNDSPECSEVFDCLWEDVERRALAEEEEPLFAGSQSLADAEYFLKTL